MIKKYNMYIKENLDDLDELDYEEEEDEPEMILIGWKEYNLDDDWRKIGYVYILQKIIDDDNMIFYSDRKYHRKNVKNYFKILSENELKEYIYSNIKSIIILGREDNEYYYWKDLPKEIKDLL